MSYMDNLRRKMNEGSMQWNVVLYWTQNVIRSALYQLCQTSTALLYSVSALYSTQYQLCQLRISLPNSETALYSTVSSSNQELLCFTLFQPILRAMSALSAQHYSAILLVSPTCVTNAHVQGRRKLHQDKCVPRTNSRATITRLTRRSRIKTPLHIQTKRHCGENILFTLILCCSTFETGEISSKYE